MVLIIFVIVIINNNKMHVNPIIKLTDTRRENDKEKKQQKRGPKKEHRQEEKKRLFWGIYTRSRVYLYVKKGVWTFLENKLGVSNAGRKPAHCSLFLRKYIQHVHDDKYHR